MKTLQLSGQKARSLYKSGSKEMKELLEENFGKDFFNQDVTDRIDEWEDMMAETGRPDVPEFSDAPEDLRPYFKSVYRNVVMAEAYNGGERMDIYNSSKHRYYLWFRMSPSTFAFGGSDFVYSCAFAGSGSRLSFIRKEHAIHAGKNHTNIFREMLES
ncbi:MAG: hypothetical protein ACK5M3_19660 [Dysgonomonas sp.]